MSFDKQLLQLRFMMRKAFRISLWGLAAFVAGACTSDDGASRLVSTELSAADVDVSDIESDGDNSVSGDSSGREGDVAAGQQRATGPTDAAPNPDLALALEGFANLDGGDAVAVDDEPTNTGDERSGSEESTTTSTTGEQATATTAKPSSTQAPTTQRTTTTGQATTTARPTTTQARQQPSGDKIAELGVGASLPSGSECASRVTSKPEVRRNNASKNQTKGSGPNSLYPRVDGNFTGTTDEIIQWAACKWGVRTDAVRAQALVESWWDTTDGGDETSDQSKCHPDVRNNGQCPQSVGILQIKYSAHPEAYEDANALRSTAYNIDFAYGHWRACYEGRLDWLNTVPRGREYRAGDGLGCMGVWFAGRWYNDSATEYMNRIEREIRDRRWESKDFLGYDDWIARGGS